ncbi:Protein F41D3.9 [Aphelenchoides avenae]|nr:Protein F41D3.9 [Aphelenchus avenae]
MQFKYPTAHFVFYDLGLAEPNEQLNTLGFFFWVDASPRLACSNLSVFPAAVLNRSVEPFFTYAHAGHSIFSATHPGMVEYFPVNDVRYLQVTEMKGATGIYVSDSEYTRELLKWTVLCALTEDCIAPKGSQVDCKFGDRYNDYASCHRFDQSAMALVRLHLLYTDGYYKELKGGDRLSTPFSPVALANLSTKWEMQFEPFESCFHVKGGDYFYGAIALC